MKGMNFEEWQALMRAQRNGGPSSQLNNHEAVVAELNKNVPKYEGKVMATIYFDVMLSESWTQFNMYESNDMNNPVVSFTPQTAPQFDDTFEVENDKDYICKVTYTDVDPKRYFDYQIHIDKDAPNFDDLIGLWDNFFLAYPVYFSFAYNKDNSTDGNDYSWIKDDDITLRDAIGGNLIGLNQKFKQYAIDNEKQYYFSFDLPYSIFVNRISDDQTVLSGTYNIDNGYWDMPLNNSNSITLLDIDQIFDRKDMLNYHRTADYPYYNCFGELKDNIIYVKY